MRLPLFIYSLFVQDNIYDCLFKILKMCLNCAATKVSYPTKYFSVFTYNLSFCSKVLRIF